jgi:hypothetical protein
MKWLYYIAACVVGLLSILPYLTAYMHLDTRTAGTLHYFYQDSELVYLSRIRDVTEGYTTVVSPTLREYKDAPVIQQPIGEWIYALAALGNPQYVPSSALALKFVFPTLLFLLVAYCARALVGEDMYAHDPIALCIALIVVLGYDLVHVHVLREIVTQTFSAPILSLWTRLVNPIVGALGLFGMSYIVLRHSEKYDWVWSVAAGALLGCMSGYIFAFAIGLTLVGILLVSACVMKRWDLVKNRALMIGVALLLNAPYLMSLLDTTHDATGLQKNGLLFSHAMLHNKTLYLSMVIFACVSVGMYYSVSKSFWKHVSWQWSHAALWACFICLNEQVITGKTVWPGHFVQYVTPLCMVVVGTYLAVLIAEVLRRMDARMRAWGARTLLLGAWFGSALIVCLTLLALPSVTTNAAQYNDSERYVPALSWLTGEGREPCVVFPVEETKRMQEYITAYTGCDVYESTYVFLGVPEERILHNYVVHLRLQGVTEDTLPVYLDTHEDDIRAYFFEDWADKFSDGNDTWVFNTRTRESMAAFLPAKKQMITHAYHSAGATSLHALLQAYAISYLMVDTRYDELPHEASRYPEVFNAEGIRIYEVK